MNNTFNGTGIISDKLRFYELNELKDFISKFQGQRFTYEIKVQGKKKSDQLLGYYWYVVIPKMKKGFFDIGYYYGKKEKVDYECRKLCDLYDEKTKDDLSGYEKRLKRISELDLSELYEYIFILKIIAAEYLNVYIDDPYKF